MNRNPNQITQIASCLVRRAAFASRLAAFGGLLVLAACSSDAPDESQAEQGRVTITSELAPYDVCLVASAPSGGLGASVFPAVDGGGRGARVNVVGNSFIDGDFIRLKIICPFVSTTERGEYTEGDSYDAFYYLRRSGSSWECVVKADGFDICGTYVPSNSPDINRYYEAQQTPYVYVATTFSEERRFVANGHLYDHLTPVFHADQTKEKHYRASDVLWAQTFMQTGAWNIHLGFQHKMACLDITIVDAALTDKISDAAVLTLEGMPDIDQAEIVVGDYYADASKYNSGYGYRQKSSCSYGNNGKVLGIAVNDESAGRAKVWPMTGNPTLPGGANSEVFRSGTPVPNTATYTAYKEATKHYRLIVPPCNLDPELPDDAKSTKHAVFWLRDGTRRFKIELPQLKFEEGKLYAITLKPSNPTPAPDSGSQSDPGPIPTP